MSTESKGEGEGEQSSSSSSSSSGEVASGTMEASDEGRYAEDIPAKEIEDSLHQAEVRCRFIMLPIPSADDRLFVTGRRCSSSCDGR
jgi:hypothetical protein